MSQILPQKYYQQNTLKIAQDLLGKFLVRELENKKIITQIIETEAYLGPNDLASHASKGKTPRNQIMFDKGGFWYVYLIYGMYYCLNVVTEKKDYPAAVLIRAVKPIKGLEIIKKNRRNKNLKTLTNGPGKLCEALKINKNFNEKKAYLKETKLYILNNQTKKKNIIATPRIGIDYAGEYKNKLWRFVLKESYK